MHPASTTSSAGHEREVLRAKRSESASTGDAERPDEVEALRAKLAGNVAATEDETRSLSVLKAKSVDRDASSTSTPLDDDLEILKAKRGEPGALSVERPDEVQTLKAKLAGNLAKRAGETTPRTLRKTKSVGRGAPMETLPRGGFGVATPKAKPTLVEEWASDGAALRRRSAFDLAFALVIALWSLAVALALTTGADWWFFGFCVVATTLVALFGVLGSTGFRQEPDQN